MFCIFSHVNVLTLAIAYKGVAFPILISMLDKRGNSHTQERIALINRYISLFACEMIDCLTDLERIEKLFSIVMVAFAWAYVVEIFVM